MTTSTGSAATATRPADGPGVLDALSLLAEVADGLVLASVRDTHVAVLDRVHGLLRRPTAGTAALPEAVHRDIAGGVYGALGLGLRGASRALAAAAAADVDPRLEADPRGRWLNAAVNGLIGDRLAQERPRVAIRTAPRVAGRDVPVARGALAAAYPGATGRVAVFLHGLCEDEEYWTRDRGRPGQRYPDLVAGLGWTPVLLRANTGLPLRANGVALSALLQRLVEEWPVPVTEVALVGHSMGGLITRAAAAVAVPDHDHEAGPPWTRLVTEVVTLGTPHHGSPVAVGVGHGARALARLPETAAFGRVLDWRSRGVHDLVTGLGEDVAPLPHARYRLVSAALPVSPEHPLARTVGDLLVTPRSAWGHSRAGRALFPDGEVLHVGRAHHWTLLDDPRVAAALRRWLA